MNAASKSAAVVGGGLMGCLSALVLANKGWRVVLFEREHELLSRASRNNEGKIHLGYTYGLDRSGDTPRAMFNFGIRFQSSIEAILGVSIEDTILHDRGIYAVERTSLLTLDEIDRHIAFIDDQHRANSDSNGLPTVDGGPLIRRFSNCEIEKIFSERILAAFEVAEKNVDVLALCRLVADVVVQSPRIEFVMGAQVGKIECSGQARINDISGKLLGRFDIAVNAAWEGLPQIEQLSDNSIDGLCFRGKAGFLANIESGMPSSSVTFVWGRYGDIVPRSASEAYLSWYPECLMGFQTDTSEGCDWFDRIERGFDADIAYRNSCAEFEQLMPGLVIAPRPYECMAGAILAHASSDIDDPRSGLHRRTRIGISRRGSVFTINTGKLTCAPGLALELAART